MNVDRNDPKNDIVSLELIDPEKAGSTLGTRTPGHWLPTRSSRPRPAEDSSDPKSP